LQIKIVALETNKQTQREKQNKQKETSFGAA